MIEGVFSYAALDPKGESAAAAARMEARATLPASEAMFEVLVRPLLELEPRRVLEVGCGTGALAARIAAIAKRADVLATDKSEGMLERARSLRAGSRVRFATWDASDPRALSEDGFDLIVSSVMVPYLSEEAIAALVGDLARRLAPGGALAFVEQDLQTDFLWIGDPALVARVMAKDARSLGASWSLGLRPLLRAAGLEVAPRRSFLWATDEHVDYTRDLLAHLAADAARAGRVTEAERTRFLALAEEAHARGDFAYGIVYHRALGRRVSRP